MSKTTTTTTIGSAADRPQQASQGDPVVLRRALLCLRHLRQRAGLPRDGFNWIFARHGVFIFLPVPDGTVWWTAQVAAREPPPDPAAIGVAELTALFGAEAQATAVPLVRRRSAHGEPGTY